MTTTETTTEQAVPPPATPSPPGRRPRARRRGPGLRTRVVSGFVVLLILATSVSVLILREVLLARLDEDVTADLEQEVSELRRLVGGADADGGCVAGQLPGGDCEVGRNPATGEPFGDDLSALFDTFLRRNLPPQGEVILTFIGGDFFRSSNFPVALEEDPFFGGLGRTVTDRTVSGVREVNEVGTLRYIAVPVTGGSGETSGVFVVADRIELRRADIDDATRAAGTVGAVMVVIASGLAYLAAGRILRPVRALTQTAMAITDHDLSARIDVRGDDEISEVARTFNNMLDRIEEAFAAQRNFIDDAGHELRTPITIIRGHLELLGDDPEERAETIPMLTDELDRMSRMVNDLLTLAKSGRPDFLTLEEVDVGALTEAMHAKASAIADRRWHIDARGRGQVVADRQRLTQAVIQLAANAAQHTAPGDEIRIGSRVAGGQVAFWVRDTGSGIRPEDTDRIFERFARASDRRRSSDGAGLGLSIVQAIARAHGGRAEVDSAPGRGATFTIVLPHERRTAEREWEE